MSYLGQSSSGKTSFSWVEVYPHLHSSAIKSDQSIPTINCPAPCPALGGCISPNLLCDGYKDCPSGWDETEANCSHLMIPFSYLYLSAGLALSLFLLTCVVLLCRIRTCRTSDKTHCQSNGGGLQYSSDTLSSKIGRQEDIVKHRVSNGTVETILNHKDELS